MILLYWCKMDLGVDYEQFLPNDVIFLLDLCNSLRVVGLNGGDAFFEQLFLSPYHFQVLTFVFLIGTEHELVLVDGSDRSGGKAGSL